MGLKCLPVGGVTPEDVGKETAIVVTKKGFDYLNRNHFDEQLQKRRYSQVGCVSSDDDDTASVLVTVRTGFLNARIV